jgi:hypothetical protein
MQEHKDVPKGVQGDNPEDNNDGMEEIVKSDKKVL